MVLASQGYPGAYEIGKVITGIDQAEPEAVVFHAGTRLVGDQLLTDGGRVLGVTAPGADLQAAIAQVYQAVAKVQFEGCYYRRDIAHRALKPKG